MYYMKANYKWNNCNTFYKKQYSATSILGNVCVYFYKYNAITAFTAFSHLIFFRKQILKIVLSVLVQTITSKNRHEFETTLHQFNNHKYVDTIWLISFRW